MPTMTPTLEDRFEVRIGWNEDIEAYVARVPDIPQLVAWDEDQGKALKKIRKTIRANIQMAQEHGDPVPTPSRQLVNRDNGSLLALGATSLAPTPVDNFVTCGYL